MRGFGSFIFTGWLLLGTVSDQQSPVFADQRGGDEFIRQISDGDIIGECQDKSNFVCVIAIQLSEVSEVSEVFEVWWLV
jgi:hypothetical protein